MRSNTAPVLVGHNPGLDIKRLSRHGAPSLRCPKLVDRLTYHFGVFPHLPAKIRYRVGAIKLILLGTKGVRDMSSSQGDYDRPNNRRPSSTSSARRSSAPRSRNSAQGGQRRSASSGQRRQAAPAQRREASSAQRRRAASNQHRRAVASAGYQQTAQVSRRRPQDNRRRQGGIPPQVFAAVAGLLVIGIVVLLILHPWNYKVVINGEEVTVSRNATISDAIEEGFASPHPGDLLDIEGQLLEEDGGDAFAAVVNGESTNDPEFQLKKGDVVEISDGADTTESFTSSEVTIPHGERTWDTEMGSYWNGSIHVVEQGEDGIETTKTGDVSGKTITEETKPAVDSGYHIYTADVGEDKVVALTFDDGPWPDSTDAILDVLEANGAKATFFTIGNQIPECTEQLRREYDLGMQICTHSYDHAAGNGQGVNLTYMTADEQVNEILKGYESIKEVTGEEPVHYMRAPGGNYYGDIISTLQPYVDAEFGWDVDTEDWQQPGADAIYERIMSVQPGQIVLMHDGGGDRSQTVEAVSRAVPELIAQGYTLVTVGDLLQYPAPQPAMGQTVVVQ